MFTDVFVFLDGLCFEGVKAFKLASTYPWDISLYVTSQVNYGYGMFFVGVAWSDNYHTNIYI
jgi:hypothetical protein